MIMNMKKYIFYALSLLFFMTSCNNGPDFGDALYMTGTLTSSNVRFLVDGQSSMGITVTSTAKTDTDIKIKLAAAPDLLEAFNASTGRNCQLPPEGSYTLEGNEVIINAGKHQSSQIKVNADSDK